MYTQSSLAEHLHKESDEIRIGGGVSQWDTISPKLFTATLESIEEGQNRRSNWENKCVKLDGEFLNNLCVADDKFLRIKTPHEIQQMLSEMTDENRQMGVKMNIAKTNVMFVDDIPMNVNNVLIIYVEGYVYMGEH